MKRTFSFFLFLSIFFGGGFFFLAKPSSLSAYTPNQDILLFEKNVYGTEEFNNESHSYATTENTIQTFNNMILGCNTEECRKSLSAKGLPVNGAIGTTANLITALYTNPPASSVYYLADLGQRLNLAQPAYAQGVGFSGLAPILPLWKATRNAAYVFLLSFFLLLVLQSCSGAKLIPKPLSASKMPSPKQSFLLFWLPFLTQSLA
jgi:hypothetical protein